MVIFYTKINSPISIYFLQTNKKLQSDLNHEYQRQIKIHMTHSPTDNQPFDFNFLPYRTWHSSGKSFDWFSAGIIFNKIRTWLRQRIEPITSQPINSVLSVSLNFKKYKAYFLKLFYLRYVCVRGKSRNYAIDCKQKKLFAILTLLKY